MDFFSTHHAAQQANQSEDSETNTDMFAKAINDRYSAQSALLTSNLHPPPSIPTTSSHSHASAPAPELPPARPFAFSRPPPAPMSLKLPFPAASSSRQALPRPNLPTPAPPATSSEFPFIQPSDLPNIVRDPHTLVLDIRALTNHHAARLFNALPLSVPSTLLKRPLFSTEKLAEMLPTRATRRKFSDWRSARRILVYDADSSVLTQGSNVLGLLRKFRSEAQDDPDAAASSARELVWLKGGFQAAWRDRRELIDTAPITDRDDDDEESTPSGALGESASANPMAILRTKHLPMAAFSVTSTTSQRSGATAHHQQYLDDRHNHHKTKSGDGPSDSGGGGGGSGSGSSTGAPGTLAASNPFYDNIRQNLELSQGITERIALRISRDAKERVQELPFDWLREIGRWAGIEGEDDEDEDEVTDATTEWASGSGQESDGYDSEGFDSGEGAGSGDSGVGPLKSFHTHHHHHHHAHGHGHHAQPTQGEAAGAHVENEDVAEGSEALAYQFYRIELGEQRRLMGVMEHHSRQSGRIVQEGESAAEQSSSKSSMKKTKKKRGGGKGKGSGDPGRAFPYSITAGVEKGAKNRYRNIWPFEHARVRLKSRKSRRASEAQPSAPALSAQSVAPATSTSPSKGVIGPLRPLALPKDAFLAPPVMLTRGISSLQLPATTPAPGDSSDDYVNASYVQPLGTTKRYIATQGPLEETFVDFWTLVWEQNVHVIVMLTREVEGATIKSGNYWSAEKYGPLRLKLVSTSGAVQSASQQQQQKQPQPDDYFRLPVPTHRPAPRPKQDLSGLSTDSDYDKENTIKRVLELSHTSFPHLPPRRIVQLQYLAWPDMNVPDDPAGILQLIRQVEREIERSECDRGMWEGIRRPDQWRGPPKPGALIPLSAGGRGGLSGNRSGSGSDSERSASDLQGGTGEDAADTESGIMYHALGERPVLLHCSAGVGRTGGFIAVDAVLDGIRREMRMRRETAAEALGRVQSKKEKEKEKPKVRREGGGSGGDYADNEASAGRGSGSGSGPATASEQDEETPGFEEVPQVAMEVDLEGRRGDEPSAGGLAAARMGPGLVMSLPLAGQAVHVPIAHIEGDGDEERMDVDKPSPWITGDPSHAVQRWTGMGVDPPTPHASGATSPPLLHGYRNLLSPASVQTPADSSGSGSGPGSVTGKLPNMFFASPSPIPPATASPSASPPPSGSGTGSGSASAAGGSGSLDSGNVSSGSGSGNGNGGGSGSFGKRIHHHPTHTPGGSSISRELVNIAAANRTRAFSPTGLAPPTSLSSAFAHAAAQQPQIQRHNLAAPQPRLANAPEASAVPRPSSVEGSDSSGSGSGSADRSGGSGSNEASGSSLFDASGSSNTRPTSSGFASSNANLPLPLKQAIGAGSGSSAEDEAALEARAAKAVARAPALAAAAKAAGVIPSSKAAEGGDSKSASPGSGQGHSPSSGSKGSPPTFDYTMPRVLHDDHRVPVLLSSLDEPIRRVIEDMREQRMSLCQSLRQYVFVHRAVLEGALALVDEERALYGKARGDEEGELRRKKGKDKVVPMEDIGMPSRGDSMSPTKSKRKPSPTELPHEDVKGDVVLSKRPSMHRKLGAGL